MPKKFSGWKEAPTPGLIHAPDETVLIIRYSQSVPYIDVTERDNKPIVATQALSVMLQLAMKFLVALTQERRSMLVGPIGEGGNSDDTKEK